MNVIDRYVYDVIRRLPERQQEDVGKELRVEIEAMAEDEARGKRPTKKQVYDVLMRMGDPAVLADQYAERQRYVVSPLYFATYAQLLKTLLLIVVPIIIFLTFTGKLATVNDHIFILFIYSIGVGVQVAVHIFFWVTLTFFLVERYGDKKDIPTETWTPDKLPALPGKQKISKTDALAGVAWSVLAIWATALQIPDVHKLFASDMPLFFAPEMWPYWTVLLLILSVLSLGAEIMKLVIGGWTGLMTAVITVVNVLLIGYFVSLISFVAPVANPEFTSVVAKLLNEPDVTAGVDIAVKVFVVSVVVIGLYEIVDAVRKYVMSKRRNI